MKRTLDYYLLWFAVIISLGLNMYLINVLIDARRQAAAAALSASVAVGDLADGAIDYNVQISESLPVSMTVGYEDEITVPISVTLPISTEVEVPLRTPLGTFPIVVPVITTLPINLRPTIPISLELPISTTVPINVDFPIHVELRDTVFGASLADAEAYLASLAEDLGAAPLPAIVPLTPTPE